MAPLRGMPKYVLMDQRAIWTSPFHTSKKNVKYWVIWGGVVGGLIAADKHIENAARRHFPSDVVAVGAWAGLSATTFTASDTIRTSMPNRATHRKSSDMCASEAH